MVDLPSTSENWKNCGHNSTHAPKPWQAFLFISTLNLTIQYTLVHTCIQPKCLGLYRVWLWKYPMFVFNQFGINFHKITNKIFTCQVIKIMLLLSHTHTYLRSSCVDVYLKIRERVLNSILGFSRNEIKLLHQIEERLGNLVAIFSNTQDKWTSLLAELSQSVQGRNERVIR